MRHVLIDNEPWFVAADVFPCLGMPVGGSAGGVTKRLKFLSFDERRTASRAEEIYFPLFVHTNAPRFTLVSESGLYKLIMRADKQGRPEVASFQDWVTREVLPSIRKTGGYILNEDMRSTAAADSRSEFPMPSSFSDALRKLADEVERRERSLRNSPPSNE